MKVKDILNEMADRAFAFSFRQGINDLYNDRDYGDTERDYQTGFNHLLTVLTEEQQAALNRMEGAYSERRYYAAEYGFKCGLYGAFRQFFGYSGAKDGGFQDLVADDLLVQPGMQRHRSNYANIELCNQIDADIMQALSEKDQEHMVSVVCAWQQRVYSAAMEGFYCGYRAAYEIMGTIDPLVKIRCVDRILTMEYYLGYIKPYSEVEQLQNKAA